MNDLTAIKLNLLDRDAARRPLFTAPFVFALIVTLLFIGGLAGAQLLLDRRVQAYQIEMSDDAELSRDEMLSRAQTLVEREGRYREEAQTLLGLFMERYRQADLMRTLGEGLPAGVQLHMVNADRQNLAIQGAAPGLAELDATKRALREALGLARLEEIEPTAKQPRKPGALAFRLVGEW